MSDPSLAQAVLIMQRVGDNVRMRVGDLEHVQREERRDLAHWINQQIKITEEVLELLRGELEKVSPAPQPKAQQLPKLKNQNINKEPEDSTYMGADGPPEGPSEGLMGKLPEYMRPHSFKQKDAK